MSAPTGVTVAVTAGRLKASRVSGLRRASFAAFVMLVVQFALGIYVNLYVTVPSADHEHGLGQAIANGPAGLTLHIVLGLLLILAALGFLVQAIQARQPALIAAGVLGLLAMIGAAGSGSAFTSSGRDSTSMAMAALAAVGLLCYGTSLFLLPRQRAGGHDG
jgi:small-conductance mechanosensitive channel